MKLKPVSMLLLLAAASSLPAQEPPQTRPVPIIKVTDKAALEAARGTNVTIEGRVSTAEWSDSGKVLNVEFADAPHFMVAAFDRGRKKLDEAFSGDAARTMTGAMVRINGTIEPYGGHTPKYKDTLQMILRDSSHLTIVEPAAAAPPAP